MHLLKTLVGHAHVDRVGDDLLGGGRRARARRTPGDGALEQVGSNAKIYGIARERHVFAHRARPSGGNDAIQFPVASRQLDAIAEERKWPTTAAFDRWA